MCLLELPLLLQVHVIKLENSTLGYPLVPIFVPPTVMDEVLGLLVLNLSLDTLGLVKERPVETENLFTPGPTLGVSTRKIARFFGAVTILSPANLFYFLSPTGFAQLGKLLSDVFTMEQESTFSKDLWQSLIAFYPSKAIRWNMRP